MHEWRRAGQLALLRDALAIFGLGSLAEEVSARLPSVVELADAYGRRARRGDFAEADRLRAEIDAAGWEVRDEPGGFRLVPK